jgi:hypothetical protein
VPAVVNGVNGVSNGIVQSEAAKVLQQARFQQHRQNPGNALAYMPGAVTGWSKFLFFALNNAGFWYDAIS